MAWCSIDQQILWLLSEPSRWREEEGGEGVLYWLCGGSLQTMFTVSLSAQQTQDPKVYVQLRHQISRDSEVFWLLQNSGTCLSFLKIDWFDLIGLDCFTEFMANEINSKFRDFALFKVKFDNEMHMTPNC